MQDRSRFVLREILVIVGWGGALLCAASCQSTPVPPGSGARIAAAATATP